MCAFVMEEVFSFFKVLMSNFHLLVCICSGGRDLSGNKRTNVMHSFDQKFEKLNEALRVSCRKGYPVRVVRCVGIN